MLRPKWALAPPAKRNLVKYHLVYGPKTWPFPSFGPSSQHAGSLLGPWPRLGFQSSSATGSHAATTHCAELDAVVAAAKVPCPYRAFGCERYVVYHGAADHKRACQSAPCACPEPGCLFVGSRGMLLDHFAAAHSRLAVTVRYGRSWNLSFPLSQSWHVLVGEEDKSVFIVSLGALGAATAVSLVCVRADAVRAPQFWCKLSVERPGDDKDNLVLMASTVGSSALTGGAPVPGQGMFLAVPQELLSGDMLALSIRIDHIRPAAAAPKSTTPQAWTPRRMQ